MHPALPFYILSALGAAVAIASLGLPGTYLTELDTSSVPPAWKVSVLANEKGPYKRADLTSVELISGPHAHCTIELEL